MYFEDSLSSVILRCGPQLTELSLPVALSDAAVNHLIQLSNLHTWRVEGPPPSYSALSLPLVFPPLKKFTLGEEFARGWFSLFERLERNVSAQGMTPLSRLKESLKSLNVGRSLSSSVNVSLISTIRIFHNLATLDVGVRCHDKDIWGSCTFKLNNNNVAELAMALPQLDYLRLGYPCSENACATTAACLLLISVHCIRLRVLEIHFNTTNIVGDLENISKDPQFEELRFLPRCTLLWLEVFQMPLDLDESNLDTVASGMVNIFPSLGGCRGDEENLDWRGLSEIIESL